MVISKSWILKSFSQWLKPICDNDFDDISFNISFSNQFFIALISDMVKSSILSKPSTTYGCIVEGNSNISSFRITNDKNREFNISYCAVIALGF